MLSLESAEMRPSRRRAQRELRKAGIFGGFAFSLCGCCENTINRSGQTRSFRLRETELNALEINCAPVVVKSCLTLISIQRIRYVFVANYKNDQSYSLLLRAFSSDEKAAASAYSKLRDSLVRFFELKGDRDSEQSADETLDRVSSKLGGDLLIEDLTKYSFGVARLVALENFRKIQGEEKALRSYQAENSHHVVDDETDGFSKMRDCFGQLSLSDRELLHRYFADMLRSELDEERRKLADTLGVSQNNLRLKIFRLRRRLENCVRKQR